MSGASISSRISTSCSLFTSSTVISSNQELERLQDRIGYRFSNLSLLERALTHKSFTREHNERLEFLGDAVLGYVIARSLHDSHRELAEDALTMIRAQFVRRETLAEIALELALGEGLRLGTGERKSGGRQRESILADALEAVFGAVEQDGGVEAVRGVILRLYQARLSEIGPDMLTEVKDPKTQLQELLQGVALPLPSYEMLSVEDGDPEPVILVVCRVESLGLETHGSGRSRRIAEQVAAAEMIDRVSPHV